MTATIAVYYWDLFSPSHRRSLCSLFSRPAGEPANNKSPFPRPPTFPETLILAVLSRAHASHLSPLAPILSGLSVRALDADDGH